MAVRPLWLWEQIERQLTLIRSQAGIVSLDLQSSLREIEQQKLVFQHLCPTLLLHTFVSTQSCLMAAFSIVIPS